MNIAQLFDNLSFKHKDKKTNAEKTSYASFNTNRSSPVSTTSFLLDRI